VSIQSAHDLYVTAITVVSCSDCHASLGSWSSAALSVELTTYWTTSRDAKGLGTGKGKGIAVCETSPSPLEEITYHMGSHGVTCHPAEVTFPLLPQPKLVLDLATPKGCKAELT